jgi:hypothetical protein
MRQHGIGRQYGAGYSEVRSFCSSQRLTQQQLFSGLRVAHEARQDEARGELRHESPD